MTGFAALPLAHEEGEQDMHQSFKGISRIHGPKWLHLPTITVGFLGVQIFWSVEMSYASPYLLSLGISKSHMAVVFLAGPISGLFMQPLIGILADNSTSRFGRRRPYMFLGTMLCMAGMLLLGFTRSFASIFTGSDNDSNDVLTVWLAVLSIYVIDFSINAVQAVDRALLVDTLASTAQASGNAWAASMLGIGGVLGFFVGNVDLPVYFSVLGNSQLQVLSILVSLILLIGHLFMIFRIQERVLVRAKDTAGKTDRKSLMVELKAIWSTILVLPRVIQQICIIQFFAWLAWFPVLFYSTIYIGDLYKRDTPIPATSTTQSALDTEATRLGSRALFYSSLLALFINLTLPAFVSETTGKESDQGARPIGSLRNEGSLKLWLTRLKNMKVPRKFHVHLAGLWAVSHLVFALSMFATCVFGATILITFTGFSWAVTQWAPFSLLAEAILTEGSLKDNIGGSILLADARSSQSNGDDHERRVFLPGDDVSSNGNPSDDDDDESGKQRKDERHRILAQSTTQLNVGVNGNGGFGDDENYIRTKELGGGLSAKAGIILGIHNIFIVIPQFIITGMSAIVFAIFDPVNNVIPAHHAGGPGLGTVHNDTAVAISGNNTIKRVLSVAFETVLIRAREVPEEGQSNSVVYIFRFGGVAAMIAFILSWRLAREMKHR